MFWAITLRRLLRGNPGSAPTLPGNHLLNVLGQVPQLPREPRRPLANSRATVWAASWSFRPIRPEVQDRYNADLKERSRPAVWLRGCRGWYLHASGSNRAPWPGSTVAFRRRTKHRGQGDYWFGEVRDRIWALRYQSTTVVGDAGCYCARTWQRLRTHPSNLI